MINFDYTINEIQNTERDEKTLMLYKRYYIIELLNDIKENLDYFDKIQIDEYIGRMENELNDYTFGELCFQIKNYLNEIRGYYQ